MSFFGNLFKKDKNASSKQIPASKPKPVSSSKPKPATVSGGPRVVELRSAQEKKIEQNSGNKLKADREALAREMVQFLKTHDTGNNMDDYREFRDKFHKRSEAIADGGGYHQALQEIYYRIRELCNEEGVYFHSGAVDNVFEGEYWQG